MQPPSLTMWRAAQRELVDPWGRTEIAALGGFLPTVATGQAGGYESARLAIQRVKTPPRGYRRAWGLLGGLKAVDSDGVLGHPLVQRLDDDVVLGDAFL